jgi:hypothetical protein
MDRLVRIGNRVVEDVIDAISKLRVGTVLQTARRNMN